MQDANEEERIAQNKIITLHIIRNIAFLFFLYSSTSLIWQAYLWFFSPEDFYFNHTFFHIYGFVASNIVLLALTRKANHE
jgi:hypothetical protein